MFGTMGSRGREHVSPAEAAGRVAAVSGAAGSRSTGGSAFWEHLDRWAIPRRSPGLSPRAERCTRGRRPCPCTSRRSGSRAHTARTGPGRSHGRGFRIPGNGGTPAPHIPAPTTHHRDRRGIGRARSRGVAGRSDRTRSHSDGAADTASMRCPWPGARSPCPPPVRRVAVLGLRVGAVSVPNDRSNTCVRDRSRGHVPVASIPRSSPPNCPPFR